MSSLRTARCLEYLVLSEALCNVTDLLSWDSLATQSEIGMELAEWHELLDDVEDLERRLHAFVALCGHHDEAA